MSKGKYLGLDFGDRRTGVAISDLNKEIVFLREAIAYENPSDLIGQIKALCAEEPITKIIIGLPIQMDGTLGGRVTKTYEFGQKLKDSLENITVEYFDERLTTQASVKRLREQGIKAKNQKGRKDSLSAQLILETYLASRH